MGDFHPVAWYQEYDGGRAFYAALGHLPAPGDRTTVGEYEFEVERVADRALDSVLAQRVATEDTEADR